MMSGWFDGLKRSIDYYSYGSTVLTGREGRLLARHRGARLLGCEMSGVDRNLFYHHRGVEAAAGNGVLSGGDRLWISPEVAYYWPDLDLARTDPVKYGVLPAGIDPGEYQVDSLRDHSMALSAGMDLVDCRVGKRIRLSVRREFIVVDSPVQFGEDLKVLSFEIINTLRLIDGDEGALAGCWEILQLPVGGVLVCPTCSQVVQPRCYYEPFDERHVRMDGQCVRFFMDGRHRVKIGLTPFMTNGCMGYYRRLEESASLIVRFFPVDCESPYVDVPRDADIAVRTGGDCLQAYNDDGSSGAFGEMEYHDPAVIAGSGPEVRTGRCVTHVLIGPDDAVRAAAVHLLGSRVD